MQMTMKKTEIKKVVCSEVFRAPTKEKLSYLAVMKGQRKLELQKSV